MQGGMEKDGLNGKWSKQQNHDSKGSMFLLMIGTGILIPAGIW